MYICICMAKKMGTKGIAKWVMDSIPSIAVNKFEPQSYIHVCVYICIYIQYISWMPKRVSYFLFHEYVDVRMYEVVYAIHWQHLLVVPLTCVQMYIYIDMYGYRCTHLNL